jgi:hypothetical protein
VKFAAPLPMRRGFLKVNARVLMPLTAPPCYSSSGSNEFVQ